MYTDPRMNTELAVVLDVLSYEERNLLIEKLANNLMLERKESEYWEAQYNEVRDQTVDVTPLNSRIENLMRDVEYWKGVAADRKMSLDANANVRDKQMCALGMVDKLGNMTKRMLDDLFADTPDYVAAWEHSPLDFDEAIGLVDKSKKIERIKLIRQWLPGLGLREAKDFIDSHPDYK